MPDRRRHRGLHPQDRRLFDAAVLPLLQRAVADLSWLLSAGYASRSALALVGDRYQLTERQRVAVVRCACADAAMRSRHDRCLPADALDGGTLQVDGYNVLMTVEVALSGGLLLLGRDGCLRDLASMQGSFHRVNETAPAILLIGQTLTALRVAHVQWYLDSPVSNSGRLQAALRQLAAEREWPWEVTLVPNPDAVLSRGDGIVTTADSAILDRCEQWYPLARDVVVRWVPEAEILDLGAGSVPAG